MGSLSEKRRRLFASLQGKSFDLVWLFERLEKQDKEFIKELKEEVKRLGISLEREGAITKKQRKDMMCYGWNFEDLINKQIVDKLAGDL